MKLSRLISAGALAATVAGAVAVVGAQQAPPDPKDPRIGLKAGHP
jgi:hypothetical protein